MPTKADLEEELNEKLDTDIEWSELKKEDLEHLDFLVDEGLLVDKMLKHVAKEKGSERYKELVDEWKPGTILERVI